MENGSTARMGAETRSARGRRHRWRHYETASGNRPVLNFICKVSRVVGVRRYLPIIAAAEDRRV